MHANSVLPLIEAAQALEIHARENVNDRPNLVLLQPSLSVLRQQLLPVAVRAKSHKTQGPRVSVARRHGNNLATAFWPQDGLIETALPILCGVLSGEAAFFTAKYQLHVPAGHFVFLPPRVPHPDGSRPHLESNTETDFCDLFWLYRWEGGLICHLCHSRGARHLNFEASENCFLSGSQSTRFFDLLAAELDLAGPTTSKTRQTEVVRYLLPALLAAARTDLQAGNFVQTTTPAAEDSVPRQENPVISTDNYSAILHAQHYVAFHLDQPLCIDDLARRVAMSRAQFTRQFRQTSGRSFLEFLTEARLERAKVLLHDTDWTIALIARSVGLSASQLWNLFARQLNTTPGEFRRHAQQQTQTKTQKRFRKSGNR